MARLRRQIPVVIEALRKTQQRYKRNFGHRVATRNANVKIGGYVYTTNHDQQNKLQRKAIGPFVVVDMDSDASTFVIDVDGEEKRFSNDHVTPAPRPTMTDTVPHPLLDRRQFCHRASPGTLKRFGGDTVWCPMETAAYDLEWPVGDLATQLFGSDGISYG